ncbi:Control of competence regulator ComK, YlbF/YmcA [Acididesulfobacillus acetoxydans]|uniref:Control of competence regulator ComK, YlbF/YmcA n=1 Tax=Acididesulfobacillus acetoxydans TaxID=1561005 RepID=A0A8S0X373_9FIRM|nr:YlbF family regulator [Acididesulfobacillus acetoxydans]CAA7599840.1 Control of competence regulator ComK, YlbF/YmcA [Acididesulfobacillus acetoxydans]CEJ07406.1 Uncharacterised protein family UPF0342 [Acididesulfobacillus acetoxydans]
MSQFDEIMEKCTDLGQAIARTAIYKDFKKTEYELLHNPQARKLVEDLQKLRQEAYRRQLAGAPDSPEEQEKMKQMEADCLKDPQVQQSNNANLRFQELMEKISGKIKEGIKTVDQA